MADFYVEFCKVDFLCYQGDPNWLGETLLVGGALFVIALVGGIFLSVAGDQSA